MLDATTDERDQDRAELAQKLQGIAGKCLASGIFDYGDIATAFLAVGVAAAHTCDPTATAEWLRGIADDLEASPQVGTMGRA